MTSMAPTPRGRLGSDRRGPKSLSSRATDPSPKRPLTRSDGSNPVACAVLAILASRAIASIDSGPPFSANETSPSMSLSSGSEERVDGHFGFKTLEFTQGSSRSALESAGLTVATPVHPRPCPMTVRDLSARLDDASRVVHRPRGGRSRREVDARVGPRRSSP